MQQYNDQGEIFDNGKCCTFVVQAIYNILYSYYISDTHTGSTPAASTIK
jgi:hypothetical protein